MIAVDNIGFSVGSKSILSGISFQADRGAFVGILGPNGAGKSTLLKVMSGELSPSVGSVTWLNQPLAEWNVNALAKSRGVLNQKSHISAPLENSEVVMMGRYPHFKHQPGREDYAIVDKALNKTGTLPLKEKQYQVCSGGEQQRLHVARVWSQLYGAPTATPKLFLLDEPLNNLDVSHQHNMMQLALDFAHAGNVVVAVMHDINLAAMYMNRLLFMKQGELIADGHPNAIITSELLETVYDYPMHVIEHPSLDRKMVVQGMPNTIALQQTEI